MFETRLSPDELTIYAANMKYDEVMAAITKATMLRCQAPPRSGDEDYYRSVLIALHQRRVQLGSELYKSRFGREDPEPFDQMTGPMDERGF